MICSCYPAADPFFLPVIHTNPWRNELWWPWNRSIWRMSPQNRITATAATLFRSNAQNNEISLEICFGVFVIDKESN